MHELTGRRILARAARAQRDGRLPSLVLGVRHDDDFRCFGRGEVDGSEPDGDTQYRIGSITKVFTAVLVLQLRDEGRLRLDDPVSNHVADAALGQRTIGQLLSHTAGVQAETDGDWWERSEGRPWEDLREAAARPAVPPREGGAFHYSNLGYAVLGQVVEHHRGSSWAEALRRHVLAPLGLHRTTVHPRPGCATGYAVHPWADVVLPEPAHDTAAMSPAGQLWSTARDLDRWMAFLLGDTGAVLAEATLEEMAEPRAVAEGAAPGTGYGLGLMVARSGGRTRVGHGGSMPGFVAGLWADREERTGAVVLSDSTSGLDGTVPSDVLDLLAEQEPRIVEPWAPLPAGAPSHLDLAGVWYTGPLALGIHARADGFLELRPVGGMGRSTRLAPSGTDCWRGLDGYFAGETLRVVRDEAGDPRHLDLASFTLTRQPYAPVEVIPGGVDPGGWRGR